METRNIHGFGISNSRDPNSPSWVIIHYLQTFRPQGSGFVDVWVSTDLPQLVVGWGVVWFCGMGFFKLQYVVIAVSHGCWGRFCMNAASGG